MGSLWSMHSLPWFHEPLSYITTLPLGSIRAVCWAHGPVSPDAKSKSLSRPPSFHTTSPFAKPSWSLVAIR